MDDTLELQVIHGRVSLPLAICSFAHSSGHIHTAKMQSALMQKAFVGQAVLVRSAQRPSQARAGAVRVSAKAG